MPKTVAREVQGMREKRAADKLDSHLVWPVSLVPPDSHGYPAGVFSCCSTRVDHRSSLVRTSFFRSLLGLSPFSKHRTKTGVDQDAGDGLSLVTLNLDPPLLDRASGPAGLLHFLG